MTNRRRVRGLHTGSPCPAVSSLLLLTTPSSNHISFSCVCIFDRTYSDKLTPHLFPLVLLLWLSLILQNKPSASPEIQPSIQSVSLNTHLALPPANTMAKNTVVMYHGFTQKHTSEINGTAMAGAAQRAVIIKRFGKVKVECSHTVHVAEKK